MTIRYKYADKRTGFMRFGQWSQQAYISTDFDTKTDEYVISYQIILNEVNLSYKEGFVNPDGTWTEHCYDVAPQSFYLGDSSPLASIKLSSTKISSLSKIPFPSEPNYYSSYEVKQQETRKPDFYDKYYGEPKTSRRNSSYKYKVEKNKDEIVYENPFVESYDEEFKPNINKEDFMYEIIKMKNS